MCPPVFPWCLNQGWNSPSPRSRCRVPRVITGLLPGRNAGIKVEKHCPPVVSPKTPCSPPLPEPSLHGRWPWSSQTSEQRGYRGRADTAGRARPQKLISPQEQASQFPSIEAHTGRPSSAGARGRQRRWGVDVGGGLFKEAGLCCRGDLAALRAERAHPPAFRPWASVGPDRPPPGWLSFVRCLNYHTLGARSGPGAALPAHRRVSRWLPVTPQQVL